MNKSPLKTQAAILIAALGMASAAWAQSSGTSPTGGSGLQGQG